jgi:hypothetical protein
MRGRFDHGAVERLRERGRDKQQGKQEQQWAHLDSPGFAPAF